MDSTKGDHVGNKLETETALNTQIDPKLTATLSASSTTTEDDLFQLNLNTFPNEPDAKNDTTTLKLLENSPLSPQASLNTPKSDNGYNPNRIPADIFKFGKPSDWSVASNESLFSIKIGNKSGDFKSYLNSPSDYSPLSHSGGSGHLEMDPGESSADAKQNTGKSVVFVLDEDAAKQRESTSGVSVDGSVASNQSFAFPILTTGEARSSETSKNELETKSTPNPESQSNPLTPPSETQKEGSSDQQQTENNTNCLSWLLPSCRSGN